MPTKNARKAGRKARKARERAKEVLAYARFVQAPKVMSAKVAQIGDMRLSVSPMRYYVERYEMTTNNLLGQEAWWCKVQAMPRTRRQYLDWELDCATRMFERRVKERYGVLNFQLWPSENGRLIKLRMIEDNHLRNILAKILREYWRRPWLPHIIDELNRRGLMINNKGGEHAKT